MTSPLDDDDAAEENLAEKFPPLTKAHILHCSYHYWHPKYRSNTPKARLIPLSESFVNYLRADGIVLPPEDNPPPSTDDDEWTVNDGYDSDSDENEDPSSEWPEVHSRVKSTISDLGGSVSPKLNWSAPKDATWIAATNSLQCTTPNDIYLLLKSSNFITHDLEHAFDDCIVENRDSSGESPSGQQSDDENIPYHLVLRKHVNVNPALEFRCFVRNRRLLAICQRDMTHFAFLQDIQNDLRYRIQDFFEAHMVDTFPDPSFVFDVYIPEPHNRVWLIDINPWALRTDPVLFNWREILDMEGPSDEDDRYMPDGLSVLPPKTSQTVNGHEDEDDEEEDFEYVPWFMLMGADGPSGLGMLAPQYSAHKMPKEVVDASNSGTGGMSEFLGQWKDVLERRVQEDREYESDAE